MERVELTAGVKRSEVMLGSPGLRERTWRTEGPANPAGRRTGGALAAGGILDPSSPPPSPPFRNPRPPAADAQEKRGAARSHGVPWRRVTGPDLWPHEREAVEHGGPGAQRARQAVAEKTWLASGVPLQRSHVSFPGNGVPRGLPLHSVCRGAANHSRVAEGTRPSPEGVYSGVS